MLLGCSSNCAQCTSSGCQTCDSSYLLYTDDGKCYSSTSCPARTYASSTNCASKCPLLPINLLLSDCPTHCAQCTSLGCQTCDSTYLFYSGDGKCYSSNTCPSGTYATSTSCLGNSYFVGLVLTECYQ